MDLLNAPASSAPGHNPDKTQPLHVLPPASSAPSHPASASSTPQPEPAKTAPASGSPARPGSAKKPKSSAAPPARVAAAKTQSALAASTDSEAAKTSTPAGAASTPSRIEPTVAAASRTNPAHEAIEKAPPATAQPRVEPGPTSFAAAALAHQEAAKSSATATPPPRNDVTTPPAAKPTMQQEMPRTHATPVGTASRVDAAKTTAAVSAPAQHENVRVSAVAASGPAEQDGAKLSAPPVAATPPAVTTPPAAAQTGPAVATPSATAQTAPGVVTSTAAAKMAPTAQSSPSAHPPAQGGPAKTARAAGSAGGEPTKRAGPARGEGARAAGTAKGEYVNTVTMGAAKPAAEVEISRASKPLTSVADRLRWIGHKITATAFVTEILPGAGAKLSAYGALTRLNKPIGVWLLLWPVLWALWISSGGRPDPHVFIVFVLGTVLTRSAGCAINDFADRNFDGHVKRTKDRPLVTGAVDPMEAVAICAALGLIALGLALTLNELAQLLTLIGGILVVTYPFFKRFFPMPQAYLGIAFTWSVPMAFAAQTSEVSRIAIVMFLAGVAWTVAYDTMYAMVDREDDKKLGIRSSAILFGDADRFIIGIMQLMTLLGLWLIGHEMQLGLWYGLGLAFAAMFALYQQLLIRERKPEKCFRAFLNNNYFGMSVFIGILLEYTFR